MSTNYNPNNPGENIGTTGTSGGAYGTQQEGTMEKVKERVEEQTTKMKEQVGEQIAKVKEQAQETYEAGKAKMGEMVEGVRRNLSEISGKSFESLYKDTIDYVKTNPDRALFISLAVGFVLGSLFKRR